MGVDLLGLAKFLDFDSSQTALPSFCTIALMPYLYSVDKALLAGVYTVYTFFFILSSPYLYSSLLLDKAPVAQVWSCTHCSPAPWRPFGLHPIGSRLLRTAFLQVSDSVCNTRVPAECDSTLVTLAEFRDARGPGPRPAEKFVEVESSLGGLEAGVAAAAGAVAAAALAIGAK